MMSDLFLCAQPAAQAAYPCETHTWAKMAGTEMARGIDFGHQGAAGELSARMEMAVHGGMCHR